MRSRVALALPLILALGGCTDLAAVSMLSTKLVTASASWDAVGGELKASCERQQQFNPALTSCDTEAAASAGLVALNTVLTQYFTALGDAANTKSFTVQPGIDALAKSAGAIPGINAAEVSATSGLASLLIRLGTEAAREKTLRALIDEGAPLSKQLLTALDRTVPQSLQTALGAERDQMTAAFAIYIQQGGDRMGTDPAAMCAKGPRAADFHAGANFMLALEYCQRVGALQAKLDSVGAYRKSLASAQAALDELASSKTQLGAQALITKLGQIGKDLDTNIKAVAKAFGGGAKP
jgi:hypothetical protein